MTVHDPRRLESHFAFGENWQSFLQTVDEDSIIYATRALARLLPAEEVAGRSFFDIGCGSGLTMLAATRLGARSVEGIDIDPGSVTATKALLSRHLEPGRWTARVQSVLSLEPGCGPFDIVSSWGVLHHTGDMANAIRKAAGAVAPRGTLAISLYRRTPLCALWTLENRLYSAAPRAFQTAIRVGYQGIFCAALLLTGRNPVRYVREYRLRGMDWKHDVHDWLGGYPYESVSPSEVIDCLDRLGFDMVRMFEQPTRAGGLFGSHCDEFVARRRS